MGRISKIKRELIMESNIRLLESESIDFTVKAVNGKILIHRNKTLYTYTLEADAVVMWKEIYVNDIKISMNNNEYSGEITYSVGGDKSTGTLKDNDIRIILKKLGKEEITGLKKKNRNLSLILVNKK